MAVVRRNHLLSVLLLALSCACGKVETPRCDGLWPDGTMEEHETVLKTIDRADVWGRNLSPREKAQKVRELMARLQVLSATRKHCRTASGSAAATWEVVCTDKQLNELQGKGEHCEYLCDPCKQVQLRLMPLDARFAYRKL
jgi:hypothetical protein